MIEKVFIVEYSELTDLFDEDMYDEVLEYVTSDDGSGYIIFSTKEDSWDSDNEIAVTIVNYLIENGVPTYEAIHGKVNNFGDISKIEKLPYADLWTYSFPCQDLSVAGKQPKQIMQIGMLDIKGNEQVRRVYDEEGISPTLNTMQGGNRQPKVLQENTIIRKLTPLECWRLMGFKDEQFNKAKESGISNSQLYKQAGNSIVVNVLEEIFKNLLG